MGRLRILVALTAVALAFAASPVAQADPGVDTVHLVDVTIDCGDFTCTWTDIPIGGTPPGPVSVDPSSSTGSCTNGMVCTLDRFHLVFSDRHHDGIRRDFHGDPNFGKHIRLPEHTLRDDKARLPLGAG